MTVTREPIDLTEYPESDGQPMAESDPTRDYLIYAVEALNIHFQSRKNVYVSGNLFIYYRRGNNRASVSPDVFVVFGVSKRKRRSYFVWKEGGKVPQFVLELTSKTTQKQDEEEKPRIYAELGVTEYFQYDPTGDYLQPQLKGYELIDGQYQSLPVSQNDDTPLSIHSKVLGLDLRLVEPLFPVVVDTSDWQTIAPWRMRFFDPQTGEQLLTYPETESAREAAEQARLSEVQAREQAEQAKEQAEQAKEQAEQAKEQAEQAREQAEQAREQAEQANTAAIFQFLVMGMTVEQIAEILKLPLEQVQRLAQSSDG